MSNLSRRRAKGSPDPFSGLIIALVFVLIFFIGMPIVLLHDALVGLGLPKGSNVTGWIAVLIYVLAVGAVVWGWVRLVVLPKRRAEEERKQHLQQRREQQEKERRRKREQLEEQRRREEREREEQIEALFQRDAFRESIDYMSGVQFENFMANIFAQKGYPVQLTPASGDQGVDLLLTIDERRVAVQLKRYTAPVGNGAVQEALAGMIHYKAKEAWVIATSTFTKSARQLAKSTGVRLIDRHELEDWLSDLRERNLADSESDTVHQQDLQPRAVNPLEVLEDTMESGVENHTVRVGLKDGTMGETVYFTAERLGKVVVMGGAHSGGEIGGVDCTFYRLPDATVRVLAETKEGAKLIPSDMDEAVSRGQLKNFSYGWMTVEEMKAHPLTFIGAGYKALLEKRLETIRKRDQGKDRSESTKGPLAD